MIEYDFLEILYGIIVGGLGSVSRILIVIACLYYLFKKGTSTSGIFLIIGAILGLFCMITSYVGMFYVSSRWGAETYAKFAIIVNIIGTIAGFIFAIGFALLIRKLASEKITS